MAPSVPDRLRCFTFTSIDQPSMAEGTGCPFRQIREKNEDLLVLEVQLLVRNSLHFELA